MKDVTTIQPDPVERDNFNFPSHFVDPQIKRQKNWCMEYARAFHAEAKSLPSETSLFRNNANYTRYRRYARGEQSPDQYKELLGLKRNQGKLNTSYRNLDFSIYKIAPKMKNVVVNKVLGRKLNINAKVIDPQSLNERRAEKNKMLEFVINQEQVESFERLTKMGLERPGVPGQPPPTTLGEIDPYLDMHPKNMMAMEVKDYLTLNLALNDWKAISEDLVSTLYDLGVAATRQYIDSNGMIRIRCGIPDRMATNKCVKKDFSDLIRVGEYYEITIADLKQRTQGSLGENVYKDIVNQMAGSSRASYPGTTDSYWNDSTYTYAYDREKITVFECCWYSVDREVYKEEKNYYGNNRFRKEKYNYTPYKGDATVNEGKGMSDAEYSRMNDGKKSIYRKDIKNVYCCTWIVDTNVAYEFGLMTNMIRAASSFTDAQLPWVIHTTDFMSTVGNIESPLDQFQLNYLQFQSHIAASKPDGIAIEKRSLAKMQMEGQAGEKWDPKESLMMYAELGSYVFDGYDMNDQPLPWLPIKELKNGLSEAAFQHLSIMITMLDQMRTLLGINAMTEGQAPPERLGKAVAQMSFGATDNALSYLTEAYRTIFEKTCRQIVMLIPDAMEYGQSENFSEALGLESFRFFNLNKDIGLREMGITLEEGPDDVLKERIAGMVNNAVAAKTMKEEDAIMILMEDNPYKQILMLKRNRLQNDQLEQGRQMQLVQTQAQATAQSAQASSVAKKDEIGAKGQSDMELLKTKHMLEEQSKQQAFIRDTILKKLEHGHTLDEIDKKYLNQAILEHIKKSTAVEVAEIGAEAKANAPAPAN